MLYKNLPLLFLTPLIARRQCMSLSCVGLCFDFMLVVIGIAYLLPFWSVLGSLAPQSSHCLLWGMRFISLLLLEFPFNIVLLFNSLHEAFFVPV